jgi:replicative DNA helicase
MGSSYARYSFDHHAFYRVVGIINTEDFFTDAHRTIFATIRALSGQSRKFPRRQ